MSTVAIIPCYNVAHYCSGVISATLPLVDQLIVVDDGSTDETGAILDEWVQRDPAKIELIRFPHNRGKGKALLAAFRKALEIQSARYFVTLDSDAQHQPSEIPRLVGALKEGADLVIGSRQMKKMPFRSRFANGWITRFLHWVYPHAPTDTQSGFRGFQRPLLEQIATRVRGHRYEMEFACLLLALSQKREIRTVPISTVYLNQNRSSHFSPLSDSLRILWVLCWHVIHKYLCCS